MYAWFPWVKIHTYIWQIWYFVIQILLFTIQTAKRKCCQQDKIVGAREWGQWRWKKHVGKCHCCWYVLNSNVTFGKVMCKAVNFLLFLSPLNSISEMKQTNQINMCGCIKRYLLWYLFCAVFVVMQRRWLCGRVEFKATNITIKIFALNYRAAKILYYKPWQIIWNFMKTFNSAEMLTWK